MKTLREYIDQLDEISRRDFLKGAGATAVGAAVGAPGQAKADWISNYDQDQLTGERNQYTSNRSIENPSVSLQVRKWQIFGGKYVLFVSGLPRLNLRATAQIGQVQGQAEPFRAVINNTLYDRYQGLAIPSDLGSSFILAIQGQLNTKLLPAAGQSMEEQTNIKVEVFGKIYTFPGNIIREDDLDEDGNPDAVARILELSKNK